MNFVKTIPKSFLLGISVASLLCVAGLLICMMLLISPDVADPDSNPPSQTPPRRFHDAGSHLGIYGQAAVVTDAILCAEIGTNILRQNGTAVDAAIAALFCNGVVHSQSMGIGGGFFMTIYIEQEKKAYSLVAREMAPAAATERMYVNNTKASVKGPLAVAVPGEILGYGEAKKRFGNPAVSFSSLVEPSIKLCEEGIPVTASSFKAMQKLEQTIRNKTEWKKLFINPKTDELLQVGDTYKRPVFAQTLRRIAQNGPQEFYTGKVGKDLVKDLTEEGGIITEKDLASYKIRWDEPANTTLANGMQVFSSPPPASGAITAALLSIMSHFNLTKEDATDTVSYQRFAEACKHGFAKRTLMGDWADDGIRDSVEELVTSLTDPEWGRTTRHKILDDSTSEDVNFYGAKFSQVEDAGTTHISVLAPNGDAVAVTSTINTLFGSGVMSKSTGVILNNEMDDFSTPGSANIFGIPPSESNFIRPGRRPVSSMSPTVILDNRGKVKLVIGASGGPRIITGTAYAAMNNIWFGKNIKEAIDFPRLHHQLMPMEVKVENDLPQAIKDYLESIGHKLNVLTAGRSLSTVQGISVEAGWIVTGNNDRRKSGQVDGF